MYKINRVKIAIIGDDFIKNNLVESAIKKRWGEGIILKFKHGFVNWPGEPFVSGDEVREYVGKEEYTSKMAKDADVLITQLAPVTSKVISGCRKLKVIGCCRGGPVNVNVDAASKKGIPVLNTPGRNATACAEFTVGMILCLLKNILPAHFSLKKGIWRSDFYRYHRCGGEISGKKVGIIGFGEVGSKICRILLSFGAEVLVYDPYVSKEKIKKAGALAVDFDTLLKKSHIVSIHARLTPDNYRLIGKRELDLMPSGSYLINSARGGLLDYNALYKLLKEGKLRGAALDAYDPEPPPPDSPLLKLDNTIFTPHLAGSSKEAAKRGIIMLVEDINKYFQGKVPKNCINPEVLKTKRINNERND